MKIMASVLLVQGGGDVLEQTDLASHLYVSSAYEIKLRLVHAKSRLFQEKPRLIRTIRKSDVR